MQAMKLAREFARKCDNALQKAANAVEDLINEGYTPDDALMLAGFGGYGFDN